MTAPRRALIVGAGVAGLTAARHLRASGWTATVVDKGRAPGGRVSTRRVLNGDADRPEHASMSFDHGAQYFTARDPRFAAEVERWVGEGAARAWAGVFAAFDSEGRDPVANDGGRWVGTPGMSTIGRVLARGLDVRCRTTVTAIEPVPAAADRGSSDASPAWQAALAHGEVLGPFEAVIISTPAPQAVPLLAAAPALAKAAADVRMQPCWAVMVAFDARVTAPFDAAFVSASPLAWIARDRSKPHRDLAETWVLHASGPWSAAHLDDGADAVGPFLLNAFADLVRAPLPLPVHLAAHRWRYACADPPLSQGVLVDAERRIAVCGDWCAGNRVEGAYLSGLAAAAAVVGIEGGRRD
jgi:renalase